MRHLLAASMTLGLALSAGQALASGTTEAPGARAAEIAAGDAPVLAQVSTARIEFEQGDYAQTIQALTPAVEDSTYAALSPEMKYAVLGLYARSLYGLGMWDVAHIAFVSLTNNRNATLEDWGYRFEAAQKVGDDADAALAADHILPPEPQAEPKPAA